MLLARPVLVADGYRSTRPHCRVSTGSRILRACFTVLSALSPVGNA